MNVSEAAALDTDREQNVPKTFPELVLDIFLGNQHGNKSCLKLKGESFHLNDIAIGTLSSMARNGCIDAQLALGVKYYKNDDLDQNIRKSLQWFNEAANSGEPLAMTILGFLYSDGKKVGRDLKKSTHWFEEAASLGEALAMLSIGLMYDHGEGVEQDYKKALE